MQLLSFGGLQLEMTPLPNFHSFDSSESIATPIGLLNCPSPFEPNFLIDLESSSSTRWLPIVKGSPAYGSILLSLRDSVNKNSAPGEESQPAIRWKHRTTKKTASQLQNPCLVAAKMACPLGLTFWHKWKMKATLISPQCRSVLLTVILVSPNSGRYINSIKGTCRSNKISRWTCWGSRKST